VTGPISIDFESVLNSMRLIIAERSGVPSPSEVRQIDGTSIGVTKPFHGEVDKAAATLSGIVRVILEELEGTHEAIRKTVEDMVQKDQMISDEAASILAVLDSTVAAPTSPTASPSSPSTPGSSTNWG
jgi:hypothetical protein